MSEDVYCYHCKRIFYLHSFRLKEAKTVSCLYCDKRIDKKKSIKILEEDSYKI